MRLRLTYTPPPLDESALLVRWRGFPGRRDLSTPLADALVVTGYRGRITLIFGRVGVAGPQETCGVENDPRQ